jgi:hypothetical protein
VSRYSRVYDTSYVPAAPVVGVIVRPYGSAAPETRVIALVDSGADGTLLPVDLLQKIRAPYWGTQ